MFINFCELFIGLSSSKVNGLDLCLRIEFKLLNLKSCQLSSLFVGQRKLTPLQVRKLYAFSSG